jgi:diguanylate cyclase (GGDEF)-like protein
MSIPALRPVLPASLARAENLPSIPAVAVEVLSLTQNEECTLDQLVRVIERDPALTAKLLRLSNSSLFKVGQDVSTLKRATVVLGMKTVRLMSLSFSLASSLPRGGEGFDFPGYWRRSLVAAVAGRSLALLVGSRHADEAFLCGLLSHIGQLALARCMTGEYGGVVELAAGRWPTLELEERVLGYSSADVAEVLLRDWHLPELIRVPAAYLHRPGQIPADAGEDTRRVARLMAVTALAVSVLCDAQQGDAYQKLYELGERTFALDAPRMDAFLIGLEPGIRETAGLLNLELPGGLDHGEIIERARLQLVHATLGATADLRMAEIRADELSLRNKELLLRATRDKLTGLANRAAFDEVLAREAERRQSGAPRCLGLIMMDIDRFKVFNDTHGHRAGDAVLAAVGKVLARLTRKSDLAARYGGEEFALILPATTPAQLGLVAERIRSAIEAEPIVFEGKTLRVTASFGGACLQRAGSAADGARLLETADACLYAAKGKGRNRSEISPETLHLS